MSPSQLADLERALSLALPDDYRAALLDYPLPRDPHSTEMWLCDDAAELQALNRTWREGGQPSHLFLIGGDGGEESYILETSAAPFPVLAYSSETGKLEAYASSFRSFLERQGQDYEGIELDRQRMAAAYANRRWWQFWVRPYPPGGAA